MATTTDPVLRTAYLIARSEQFRALCAIPAELEEAAKFAAAMARIFLLYLEDDELPAVGSGPFALVQFGELSAARESAGGGAFSNVRESVDTLFFRDHTALSADRDQLRQFRADCRQIVQQMAALSGASTHIRWDRWQALGTPLVDPPKTERRLLRDAYRWSGMTWGSETVP